VQKTVLALLLALTLATAAFVWAGSDWLLPKIAVTRNGVFHYDMDADGRADLLEVWKDDELVILKQDNNGDGHFDAVTYYERGVPSVSEFDLDFDGVPDYRSVIQPDGRERIEIMRDGIFQEFRPEAAASPPS
jgi:hypothetical protein